MKTFPLLFLLLVALGGCQKQTAEPTEPVAPAPAVTFVPGDLLVGIKDGVPIKRAFQLADSLHFTITRLGGFWYSSSLPKDSLAYVNRVLRSKPYLNAHGFQGGGAYFATADQKIFFTNFFFDMDLPSQQDWLATRQQLQLTDRTALADMWLKVPVGEEQRWLVALRPHPLVRWVELNNIIQVQLH